MGDFHRHQFAQNGALLLANLENKLDGFLDILEGFFLGLPLADGCRELYALYRISALPGSFQHHCELHSIIPC